jgi:hypothetical protein
MCIVDLVNMINACNDNATKPRDPIHAIIIIAKTTEQRRRRRTYIIKESTR